MKAHRSAGPGSGGRVTERAIAWVRGLKQEDAEADPVGTRFEEELLGGTPRYGMMDTATQD